MPRPKLKRRQPLHSAPSTSSTNAATKPQPSTVSKLQNSQQNHDTSNSSDSDHLVRRIRRANPPLTSQPEHDATLMHGALPTQSPLDKAVKQMLESDATRKVRKSLNQEDAVRRTRNAQGTQAQQPDKKRKRGSDALGWSQEEMAPSPATSQEEKTNTSTARPALKDISNASARRNLPRGGPSMPGSVRKPTSANVPGTPSLLSLKNFKQRPRQPSLLSMVQRAESRRNSVSAADATGLDLHGQEEPFDLGADDEDTFPDEPHQPTARHTTPQPTDSRKRKRTTTTTRAQPEPGSSPPLHTSYHHHQQPAQHEEDAGNEILVPNSQPEHLPPTTTTTTTTTTPTHHSPTPVSPPSSPPLPPPNKSPIEHATSPLSTPPSSNHPALAPPLSNPRKPTNQKKPKRMTTADLTALLPRQRPPTRRKRDEFQILSTESDTSEESNRDGDRDESADELAASSRARAQAQAQARARRRRRGGGRVLTRVNETNAKPPTPTAKNKGRRRKGRVYGRSGGAYADDADVVGEENALEGGGRRAIQPGEEKSGGGEEEMEEAKRKFEAVDEWELSFESVSWGGDSSPWR